MSPVRLLLVDDDPMFRRHATTIIEMAGFLCNTAGGVAEAERLMDGIRYDLVLADLHMPDGGGLELFRRIRARHGMVPLILVTGDPSLGSAIEALKLAAVDYVVKPVPDLAQKIREALARATARVQPEPSREAVTWPERLRDIQSELSQLEGLLVGAALRPPAASQKGPPPGFEELSEREREVALLIAEGISVAECARRLFVSTHTVRNHLKAIYRKLGVRSQVALVLALRAVRVSGSARPTTRDE